MVVDAITLAPQAFELDFKLRGGRMDKM